MGPTRKLARSAGGRGIVAQHSPRGWAPATLRPVPAGVEGLEQYYSTRLAAEKSMPTLRRIMSRVAIVLSDASSVR
jgi:hypothetical protein